MTSKSINNTDNPSLTLAGEFPPTEYEDWSALCTRTLQGKSVSDLTRINAEGISIDALYPRAQGLADTVGKFPYTRSASTDINVESAWEIRQTYRLPAPADANALILSELNRGVNAMHLQLSAQAKCKCAVVLPQPQQGIDIYSAGDLAQVLDGVFLDLITVSFDAGERFPDIAVWLQAVCAEKQIHPNQLRAVFGADPLAQLVQTGALSTTIDEALTSLAELAQLSSSLLPQCRSVAVNTSVYHNAGANSIQELALMLATAKVYLQTMVDRGLSASQAAKQIEFHVCVDTHYFLSIAKLRAARTLWAQLASACGVAVTDCAMTLHVNVSERMLSQRDPWVNMLRTTVAGTAAALGGCNSLGVPAFDHAKGDNSDLGRRVARNIQIILQEEANLHRVIDPFGGSGYIEHLTQSLCRSAWDEFTQLEAQGGLVTALKEGFVQRSVNACWDDMQLSLATRKQPLVGVSVFPDLYEKHEPASITEPATSTSQTTAAYAPNAEQIEPLPVRRLGAAFEELRDAVELHAMKQPHSTTLFLLTQSTSKKLISKIDFCHSLLGSAGFQLSRSEHELGANQSIEHFRQSGLDAVLICMDENHDAGETETLIQSTRDAGAKMILVAANPDAQLSADEFIYSGCNVLHVLNRLAEQLGITLT